MLATTNVRQEGKPAARRNRNEEHIVAASNKRMIADLTVENESNHAITCVGIIQDKGNH